MNNMRSRAALLAAALLAGTATLNAQVAHHDFSWTTDNSPVSSLSTSDDCENAVTITVNTEDAGTNAPLNHGVYPFDANVMQVPYGSNSPSLAIRVLITFSTPVRNPRLAVADLDYDHPGTGNPFPPPDELLSNFSAGFTGSLQTYGGWSLPNWTGSQVVPTTGKNQACWLQWEGCFDSISFVYQRPTDLSILLYEIEYGCACNVCHDCRCHGEVTVVDMPTEPNPDGILGVALHLNSAGVSLRQVNVSVPWWNILSDPACIDCGAHDPTEDGDIYNASTLAGEVFSFVGPPGIAHSGEITYCIEPFTPIDEQLGLRLRFPSMLDLTCCKPDVEYCVKVQFIDKDCQFCEFLICRTAEGIITKEKPRAAVPSRPAAPKQATGALQVFPNPANGSIQALVPERFLNAAYLVQDQGGRIVRQGKATSDQLRLDVNGLPAGLYTLTLRSATDEVKASFAVEK